MASLVNITERKPIWIALSQLYLDTELDESDFKYIISKIIESPYSIADVKHINKYELFPVLQTNLISIAGEWAGFNEEWIVKNIKDSLSKRNIFRKIAIEGTYFLLKGRFKEFWKKLEDSYENIRPSK